MTRLTLFCALTACLLAGLLAVGEAHAKHAQVESHLKKKGFKQIRVVGCEGPKCTWQGKVRSARDGWLYSCRKGKARVRRKSIRVDCRYRVPGLSPVKRNPGELTIGFNDSWTIFSDQLEHAGDAGGQVVRLGVSWATIQPRKGKFNWKPLDRVYSEALYEGQVMLPVVLSAPCWAATFCGDNQAAAPPDPDHYDDYGRFVAKMIKRYSAKGNSLLAGVELWNEPNSPKYWLDETPQNRDDSAGDYAKLLRVSTKEIAQRVPRASRPPILVGSPALAAPQFGYNSLNNAHLRKIYETKSHRRTDGQAIHPFSRMGPDEDYLGEIRRLISEAKTTMARAGVRGVPFWISEFGFSTHPNAPVPYTEGEKAEAVVNTLDLLARTPGIELALIHRFVDRKDDPDEHTSWFEDGMGMGRLTARREYRPLPAYCAVAGWTGAEAPLCRE